MKIALIIPANRWFCPYLNIYTKILDNNNIQYDVILWDREKNEAEHEHEFHFISRFQKNKIEKFISYFLYAKFIKKQVRKENYSKLIIFTPQVGIFISNFLKKYYKNSYIFDYRDLSIEQNRFFTRYFKRVLTNSFANIISSPGFKKYLPEEFYYLISHNFDIDLVKERLSIPDGQDSVLHDKIKILTIGGIRDFNANAELIKALANHPKYELYFVGKGPESDHLQQFVTENSISNVFFHGYYNKNEEANFIRNSDFLNIYYPKVRTHSTALSNRFYNSLIFNKPMIVTSNSIQGYFVEKYNLGLSIDDCTKIEERLYSFLSSEYMKSFQRNSKALLSEFLEDYKVFECKIREFIAK